MPSRKGAKFFGNIGKGRKQRKGLRPFREGITVLSGAGRKLRGGTCASACAAWERAGGLLRRSGGLLMKSVLEMISGGLRTVGEYIMESLILAQNERWRRVLSMQVERQGQQCP